jgi:hypothetical protein
VEINEAIRRGFIEAPYKIPVITWAKLLVEKVVGDPLTRLTSRNLLMAFGSRRGLKLLISKFTRESY